MKKRTSITIIFLFLLMLSGCGNKLKALDVESVKESLIQMGCYNDDFQDYSLAGISDIGGIINESWLFSFYDYGDQKKSLDEIIPVFLAYDLDTYEVTEATVTYFGEPEKTGATGTITTSLSEAAFVNRREVSDLLNRTIKCEKEFFANAC